MRLFKRKHQAARQSQVKGWLEQTVGRRQRQLADQLNRQTQHWNCASKMLMLVLICLLFGGASLWLLVRAFY